MSDHTHLNGHAADPVGIEFNYLRLKPIGHLMETVCHVLDVSVDEVRGSRQRSSARIMHARFCVSLLSAEFYPRIPAAAIERAMNRSSGVVIWQRARREDRIKLYPEFAQLLDYCREAVRNAK